MSRTCLALLSGGLDSMLAIRLMQEQGIEVEAIHFRTIFTCCQDQAARAALELGVRLTVVEQQDDYLDLVRAPRFGHGKGMNPCVDCRIYMFRLAERYRETSGADFVVSGELLGQRPMSQKRRDFDAIAFHAGLEDVLLRPLSARLLPPTLPERSGWVDRQRLFGFHGRGRKPLIALARRFGFPRIPEPSTGCALAETAFARKVRDLVEHEPNSGRWDFELLQVGRHFRFDEATKVVVGRREEENAALRYRYGLPQSSASVLLEPQGFNGPTALVVGPATDNAIAFGLGLIVRYAHGKDGSNAQVRVVSPAGERWVPAVSSAAAAAAVTLASA
jgi:tRNA-specific 2-thiouridylase